MKDSFLNKYKELLGLAMIVIAGSDGVNADIDTEMLQQLVATLDIKGLLLVVALIIYFYISEHHQKRRLDEMEERLAPDKDDLK